ncbi:NAD(P)H-dependent flavin oxidoreductase [Vreelandella sedimenti]|uniref:NAD(P)H-dependent flavin oxidoreductase n=1 Tax=Vreelandella sedimenti TaxID=2729618 RepID=UPI00257FA958|nr:nitronate monooxygenase [Halomonas sp. UBA3173]|tara:strand:- start:14670 stop:15659 length:990 start_codon:yes stop_codon:yes gene_type:complete
MKTIHTSITDLLNLRHPLILAPMGGASGAKLASAVSQAGGLGLVGASYGDEQWMRKELEPMRKISEPWGVGLVMFTVAKNMGLLDLALTYEPSVIALSFGDARPFVPLIHESGAKVIVQIHELDQAKAAIDAGADALIVQGAEAGGHSYRRGLMPLLPAVRDMVGETYPLIAAGGIADGRGMAAALMLGADGAMLGTRFLASEEALPSSAYKQRLIRSATANTVRTRIFDLVRGIEWPAEYSGRAIANHFSETWLGRDQELLQAPDFVRERYAKAVEEDDLNSRVIWAGEVLDMIEDVRPAAELVEHIKNDTLRVIRQVQRLQSSPETA